MFLCFLLDEYFNVNSCCSFLLLTFSICVCPQYSLAGDDSVTEAVTDLARGTLCPALKAIFQHGLKKTSLLGGPCHPWLFVEEVGD